jgi:hypothetical protein
MKPAQTEKQAQVVATYFLAKQSGLFQPGQPLILAETLVPRKSKEKPHDNLQKSSQRLRK